MTKVVEIEVLVRFWRDKGNRSYKELKFYPGEPGYDELVAHAKDKLDNYLSAHLEPRFASALKRGGIVKIKDLQGKSFRDLVSIDGVGVSTLFALQKAGFIQINLDVPTPKESPEDDEEGTGGEA